MAHGLSNGHVTDDVTWPPNVLWGSTVGYPSNSLASCLKRCFRKETARYCVSYFRYLKHHLCILYTTGPTTFDFHFESTFTFAPEFSFPYPPLFYLLHLGTRHISPHHHLCSCNYYFWFKTMWSWYTSVRIDLKELGGLDVEMFEILPRDWNLKPIFTQKWASVDMNWGFNPQPPTILTLWYTNFIDQRTDRQKDEQTTYCVTALCGA